LLVYLIQSLAYFHDYLFVCLFDRWSDARETCWVMHYVAAPGGKWGLIWYICLHGDQQLI